MPSTCNIHFDRPEAIYYSGETITGRIELTTTKEKTIREVYILFVGEAKVRWEERRTRRVNGKSQSYTVHYRGSETYLNSKTPVASEGVLPPGTHTYTYCIPLPVECPTSCVERYGQIQYVLSLVVDRPYRFDNVFNRALTVLKQLNLNLHPELLIPLKNEDMKYFCCWPCSSGPVISELTIPFGGYAPGQIVKYKLEIDNQSSGYDLNGIKLKLKQIYKFTAQSPHLKTKGHCNTLAVQAQHEPCLRLSKRVLYGELLIPPVPPSSMGITTIIQVNYHIEMSIKTGECHTDSEINIPFTIGTIPLIQSASNPENALALQQATAPEVPETPGTSDKPPAYEFYRPPSFEEATSIEGQFIDTDKDERNRIEDFIPKYPTYTNFAEPTAPPIAPPTQNWNSDENAPGQIAPDNTTQAHPNGTDDNRYGWRS